MTAKPAERFMPENPNTLQYKVWCLVDSIPFEYLIMLLIAGNTMILMLKVSNTDTFISVGRFLNFHIWRGGIDTESLCCKSIQDLSLLIIIEERR